MLYSKNYFLTEHNDNKVNIISIDRKRLDLSENAYLW